MDPLYIILRLVHIVGGMLWVGMGVFLPVFLAPAMQDLGPDAGKVMGALQKRGFMTVLPLIALANIVSGVWLYIRMSGGDVVTFFSTRMGMAFGTGGLAAITAFLIGILFTRPAILRVATMMQQIPAAAPAEREQLMQAAMQLRARSTILTRVVGTLLIVAGAIMAVARFA